MIVVVIALTVIAAGSSGLRGQGPSQEFLLSEGKAGSIEIGMPIDEILQRFGRERVRLIDRAKEGHFSPAIEIDVPGASMTAPIVADISGGPCGVFSVSGITVRDPTFRTSDGLGVGSTLTQVRQVRSVSLSREEGVWAIVQGAKITFGLDAAGSDSARVDSVWLWLEARTVRAQRCPNR